MSTLKAPRPSAVGATPRIDPRGPQVAAALTSVVLAGVLLLAPRPVGVALLAAQVVVFAVGALRGVQHTPYAWLFKTLVRPRLGAPGELEDAAPPRFAQAVGLAFGLVALAAFLAGADLLGLVATGFALTAALLNAVFRFCLGCELYLVLARWSSASTRWSSAATRWSSAATRWSSAATRWSSLSRPRS